MKKFIVLAAIFCCIVVNLNTHASSNEEFYALISTISQLQIQLEQRPDLYDEITAQINAITAYFKENYPYTEITGDVKGVDRYNSLIVESGGIMDINFIGFRTEAFSFISFLTDENGQYLEPAQVALRILERGESYVRLKALRVVERTSVSFNFITPSNIAPPLFWGNRLVASGLTVLPLPDSPTTGQITSGFSNVGMVGWPITVTIKASDADGIDYIGIWYIHNQQAFWSAEVAVSGTEVKKVFKFTFDKPGEYLFSGYVMARNGYGGITFYWLNSLTIKIISREDLRDWADDFIRRYRRN